MVKFLVIRLSSIGDIVLTTPVVRCIKKQIENSEIHFLTKKQYHQVVEHNPYIDKVWLLDKNMPAILKALKSEQFDYVIDLHHNIRTFRIKNHLRALAFSFDKLNVAKWLMVNFKLNRLPEKHIVDRYLETVSIFDVKNDGLGLDYYTGPDDNESLAGIEPSLPEKYVALCIGAQHFTKKAPPEKLAELCNHTLLPVVILGGKGDELEAEAIQRISKNEKIIQLAGKLSLNQSALIVKNSAVVVTHDTGLMHIAAAYRKRIISLWGNTIPEFGMYPYLPGEGSVIHELKGLSCRPCSKIGYSKCPKKHYRCMMDLDYAKIGESL